MINRYKIEIEYDGSGFHGWQYQKNHKSVQSAIQKAIFKFSGQDIIIEGAGRTDAGVHALAQVAHFDLETNLDDFHMQQAINYHLLNDNVTIISIKKVSQSFHARFSAKKRSYKYLIINRNAPPILHKNRSWHIRSTLDVDSMTSASEEFIGTHDFTSFRSINCQANNPIRTIDKCYFKIEEDNFISFNITSRSFLHNQVRIMVGTLVYIGLKKYPYCIIKEMLLTKDRKSSGITAPPYGLYLTKIVY